VKKAKGELEERALGQRGKEGKGRGKVCAGGGRGKRRRRLFGSELEDKRKAHWARYGFVLLLCYKFAAPVIFMLLAMQVPLNVS
jgi:hypothetical protein